MPVKPYNQRTPHPSLISNFFCGFCSTPMYRLTPLVQNGLCINEGVEMEKNFPAGSSFFLKSLGNDLVSGASARIRRQWDTVPTWVNQKKIPMATIHPPNNSCCNQTTSLPHRRTFILTSPYHCPANSPPPNVHPSSSSPPPSTHNPGGGRRWGEIYAQSSGEICTRNLKACVGCCGIVCLGTKI